MKNVFVALVVLCAACTVQAIVIPSSTTGGSDSDVLPDQTNVVLTLPQFNGPIGDLLSVWVHVKFDLSNATVAMDNDSVTSAVATAKITSGFVTFNSTASLLRTGTGLIEGSDFGIIQTQDFNLDASIGDPCGFDATLDVDYAFHDFGTITKEESGFIASSEWADYVGSGNFTITVKADYLAGATFQGSDGYYQGSTPNGSISAEVEYVYVPEPMTMSLLAIGGIILNRRRLLRAIA
ncbi:MAG: PEP-CTERM sorting domain-containing protein [Sedimentisphaerales bacterium]|nr:PEP-CTERM sorting domain-containing protein [Sedimentisphaerales bacterium]